MDNDDYQQLMNNNDSSTANSIHHHHHRNYYQKYRRTILYVMDEIMHKSGIIRPKTSTTTTKVTVSSTKSQNFWKQNQKNHSDFHIDASTINHLSLLSTLLLYTPTKMNPYNQSIKPVTINSLQKYEQYSYSQFRQNKRKRKRRSINYSCCSSNDIQDNGSINEYNNKVTTLDFGIHRHQNHSRNRHHHHHKKYG